MSFSLLSHKLKHCINFPKKYLQQQVTSPCVHTDVLIGIIYKKTQQKDNTKTTHQEKKQCYCSQTVQLVTCFDKEDISSIQSDEKTIKQIHYGKYNLKKTS